MIPKDDTPKSDPKQYRPISLLNLLGKAFAKILNKKLVTHLEDARKGLVDEDEEDGACNGLHRDAGFVPTLVEPDETKQKAEHKRLHHTCDVCG